MANAGVYLFILSINNGISYIDLGLATWLCTCPVFFLSACYTQKKKSKNKNHCILFLSVLRHAEHPTAKEGPQPLTRATNPCLVFGSGCPSLSILTR
jgi:hypothetical protein